MNKKFSYLFTTIVLAICSFLSCQKKTGDSSSQSFSIDYIDSVSIGTNCSAAFDFNMDYSGPSATLSITGLPSNISVSPASIPLTTGSQAPEFIFSCNNMSPGIYPVQLTISGSVNGTKTYYVFLKVLNYSDFAPELSGTYSIYACGYDATSYISVNGSNSNLLYITNIDGQNDGLNVNADINLNCSTDTTNVAISIPVQTVNGYTVQGAGTCYKEGTLWYINIADTISSTSGSSRICSLQLQPQ